MISARYRNDGRASVKLTTAQRKVCDAVNQKIASGLYQFEAVGVRSLVQRAVKGEWQMESDELERALRDHRAAVDAFRETVAS